MADQKVTELSPLAAATATDGLYIVDDFTGAPSSNYITVENLLTSGASDVVLPDGGGTIGSVTTPGAVTIGTTGIVTFAGNIIIPDSGYIGSASDTDAIQIEADGDVVLSQKMGIGASPIYDFHIKKAGTRYVLLEETSNTVISGLVNNTTQGKVGTVTEHDFTIISNSINRITIDGTSGHVGIGRISVSYMLEIEGRISTHGSNGGLKVYPRDGSGSEFDIYNPTGDDLRIYSGSDLFILDTSGNLTVPTTYSTVANDRALYVETTGLIGTTSSTRESKANINYDADSSFIYDLKPVTFNYKKFDQKRKKWTDDYKDALRWGLIAEDIEQINPDMALYDKEGQLEDFRKEDIYAPILKELIKLKKTVDEQQVIIEKLKSKE